jgi:hypothetical protein
MGTGHSFPKGPSIYIYCSIFPPFFHEGNPKIIFFIHRGTPIYENVYIPENKAAGG